MLKVMFHVMLQDIKNLFRAKGAGGLVLGYILVQFVAGMTMGTTVIVNPDIAREILYARASLLASVVSMVIVHYVFSMPLHISRAFYVCPTGEKERYGYIRLMLAVRVAVSLLIVAIFNKNVMLGVFQHEYKLFYALQFVLVLFTILYFNVNIGKADTGERRVDEEGYVIYTKAEMGFKLHWGIMLILQWAFLLVLTMYDRFLPTLWLSITVVVMLLINSFYMLRYVKLFLYDIILYENVYARVPKNETVQYDIV